MITDDFQKLILEQLSKLVSDVNNLKVNMATKDELADIKATMATKDELAEIKAAMATKDELAEIKATMATKDDIARLERLANGTMEVIESTYRDVDKITTQQEIHRESINIIHLRQLQTEAELSLLKKAL